MGKSKSKLFEKVYAEAVVQIAAKSAPAWCGDNPNAERQAAQKWAWGACVLAEVLAEEAAAYFESDEEACR